MGLEMHRLLGLFKSLGEQKGGFPLTGTVERTRHSTLPRRLARVGRVALIAAGASLLVAGCENPVRVRGHVPDPETIEAIRSGTHGREDVIQLLGTPSALSTFDDQKWYYIGQKTTQFAYQKPKVLERSVLVVSFDGTGYVSETAFYNLQDGQDIDPVGRITPTEGRDFTILQQILGNLGRLPGGLESERTPGIPGP